MAFTQPPSAENRLVQQPPIFPVGEERAILLRTVDPFFGTVSSAVASAPTGLNLTLFGIRMNQGIGGSSAIIAGADGVQGSFGVGEAIMPGVVLRGVAADHVVLDNLGRAESLYLDKPPTAPAAGALPAPGASVMGGAAPAPAPAGLSPRAVQAEIQFAPLMAGGRVTGIRVSPKGSGQSFQLAGFKDGDVIKAVNDREVASAADIQSISGAIRPGAQLRLSVERGGQRMPFVVQLGAQ